MRASLSFLSVTAVFVLLTSVAIVTASPPRRPATSPATPHLPSSDKLGDPNKAAFPLPDLIIVELTKGPGSRAHIRNQGKGNAGSCTLAVNCVMATLQNGTAVQSTGIWQVPALKAGGDTWVSLDKCKPVSGNIDADNAVKESNEGNNSYKAKG